MIQTQVLYSDKGQSQYLGTPIDLRGRVESYSSTTQNKSPTPSLSLQPLREKSLNPSPILSPKQDINIKILLKRC